MVDLKSTESEGTEIGDKAPQDDNEKQELIDTVQRLQAEFDNYRKRVQKDNQAFTSLAIEGLIRRLLPVLDTFDLALKSKPDEGMLMVRDQLLSVLEESGLTKIDATGKFNPALHEALVAEQGKEEPGTILEELQKGYKLADKVLRHSKVKIAKENAQEV